MVLRVDNTTFAYRCEFQQRCRPGGANLGRLRAGFIGSFPKSDSIPYPRCDEGPADRPEINGGVPFQGFLPSEGIPNGDYDLSDPRMANGASVLLQIAMPGELPVGTSRPYAEYASSVENVQAGSSSVIEQLPGLSGRLAVTDPGDENEPLLRQIDLTQVVLQRTTGLMPESVPSTVTIEEARLWIEAL